MRGKYADAIEDDMKYQCPQCGNKALRIPWTFLVESSVVAKCAACGNAYTSTLSGAMDAARRYVLAFFATVLGLSLWIFIYWWKEWIVAVVALLVLDAAWRLYLHRRSIQRSKKVHDAKNFRNAKPESNQTEQ